jgi:hypothetical protein
MGGGSVKTQSPSEAADYPIGAKAQRARMIQTDAV